MQSTGGVADRFAPLAARLERRLQGGLPFAVRFWDESELRPDGEGSVDTIVVGDQRALSYIATAPDQIGLGRAWVAGDVDLERGDISLQQLLAAAPDSPVELPLARPAFTA